MNALNSLKAIEATNARKVIPKIMDNINNAIVHFQKANVDFKGLKWFNKIGQSLVISPLVEALDLLSRMQGQVESKERRMK